MQTRLTTHHNHNKLGFEKNATSGHKKSAAGSAGSISGANSVNEVACDKQKQQVSASSANDGPATQQTTTNGPKAGLASKTVCR